VAGVNVSTLSVPAGRLAIVGLAKNCGKTTTLNAISRHLHAQARTVGLLSIGIDGETSDVLIGTPKPPVVVSEGQLVVTADKALTVSSAGWEWRESLGIRTPLGEVVLATCTAPGELVLGGLRHRADVLLATRRLRENGATHILIDGAYGRMVAAAPQISDATILSTGAVLSAQADELARLTSLVIDKLELPAVGDSAARRLGEQAVESGSVLVGTQASRAFTSSSALLGLQRERELWTIDSDVIAIPGLVSDGVVDELLALPNPGILVVPDATALHCSGRRFRKLTERWRVRVLEPVEVLGVALNPTSVTGVRVDPMDVADRLLQEHPHLTVFDPAHGLHSMERTRPD
jgi:hypothetical protein